MALIKCPECGKQISSKASSCPNCGCPITVTDKRRAEDISAEILPEEKEILEEASKKNIKAAKIGLVFSIILFCIFLVFFIFGIAYRKDSKITVACIVLSIVSFCGFLIAISIFFSKSKVLVYVLADHHDTRIFVFGNGGKPVAYANGYLLEINPTSHNGATAKYEITTPSKEDVGI